MIVETGDAEYWRDRFLYMQELYKRSAEANEKLRQALEQPKREWFGLTDEEIDAIADWLDDTTIGWSTHEFTRAIEAKLKEKNK